VPLAERDPIVGAVTRAVGLAEGERGIRSVLNALARLEPVSIRSLSRAVDLPVPIVAAVCAELRKHGVVAEERPAQLTIEGRRRFAGGSVDLDVSCPACGGRGITIPEPVAGLRRGLALVSEAAPSPRLELDQCHSTVKAKLRRVLAMHAADALAGRRILFLGDDDLVSVALARFVRRFGSAATVQRVTVIDVDVRLLAFIEDELAEAPFAVECVQHDLREPLPPSLARAFDTVVTDPPYTSAGASLFLSRAVESLRGEGSDVFLSFGSRRPGASFELQRTIARLGLEIRALTRDFNTYVGAGVLGGTSHLYHLASTAAPPPVAEAAFDGPLYTRTV
jgi:N4-bis(aminopropyl)spermidine synthase